MPLPPDDASSTHEWDYGSCADYGCLDTDFDRANRPCSEVGVIVPFMGAPPEVFDVLIEALPDVYGERRIERAYSYVALVDVPPNPDCVIVHIDKARGDNDDRARVVWPLAPDDDACDDSDGDAP